MKTPVLLIFTCITFFISCNKPSTPPPSPASTVSVQSDKSSLTLAATINSSDSFNIQSDGQWSISFSPSSPNWLNVNASSGTGNKKIIVTITQANNTGTSRSAILDIKPSSGPGTVHINITQRVNEILSVTAVDPTHGQANTQVTITGSGFDPNPALDTVYFNGKAATVVNSSSSSLIVKAPVGAGTGNVSIKVGNTIASGPVFTYDPSVTVTVIAGSGYPGTYNGVGTAAYFADPTGITVDTFGNIYVADLGAYDVRKISTSYEVTTFAGNPGHQGNVDGTGTAALFAYANDVATDLAGNVYVADFDNNNIRKITPAGVVTTLLSNVSGPTGIAVDSIGNIYVVSPFVSEVRKYSPTGQMTGIGNDFGGSLFDVTVDGSGNIYTVDHDRNVVNKITASGVISTVAGVSLSSGYANGPGATATFNNPKSIAIDKMGNIYVADVGNNAIRKIDPAGNVTTLLDHVSRYTSDASYFGPYGVTVDKNGVVYVSNTGENRILRLTVQ